MKKIFALTSAATLAMSTQLLAQSKPGPLPVQVPEISALEGAAALALLAAVVALVWERRRRAA